MRRWGWLCLGVLLACRQANPAFVESGTDGGTSAGDTSGSADPTVVDTGGVTNGGVTTGDQTAGPGATSEGDTSSGDPSTGGTNSSSGTGSTDTDPGTGSTSGDTGSDTGACAPPSMICAGACVDVTSDPDNCGKCDNGCPGNQICVDSDCTPG